MTEREEFVAWVQQQKGKPYVWSAKGELRLVGGSVRVECFDCSGLVTRGLVVAGYPSTCPFCQLDLCGFHNAQRLFDELIEPHGSPAPGDLMFFGSGPKRVDHVMVYLDGATCIGASGGNRYSVDPLSSLNRGQKVMLKPIGYRPDFVGYRSLPLP